MRVALDAMGGDPGPGTLGRGRVGAPTGFPALAVLLAQAPEPPSFPQVLVTTYEAPLIRRLGGTVPNTHLIYVRPPPPQPVSHTP